jgi:hypothetical protein
MNDKLQNQDKRQLIAGVVSVSIVAIVVIYWGIQISGVMEMLDLAYG